MLTPNQIARVCHEANRAVQIEQADPTIPVSAEWALLDDETRESAINGVLAAQHGMTPEQSHHNWVSFKVDHGWTFGPVKDEDKKTHPLLVHYEALPASQKLKDDLFLAIVKALS